MSSSVNVDLPFDFSNIKKSSEPETDNMHTLSAAEHPSAHHSPQTSRSAAARDPTNSITPEPSDRQAAASSSSGHSTSRSKRVAPSRKAQTKRSKSASQGCSLGSSCKSPEGRLKNLVRCDKCSNELHLFCAGFKASATPSDVMHFYCKSCVQSGSQPKICPRLPNRHRHIPFERGVATNEPIQVGTPRFIEWLTDIPDDEFAPKTKGVLFMAGRDVRYEFFVKHGFDTPIVVRDLAGLGCKMPNRNISLDEIQSLLGDPNRSVDVIDTRRQIVKYMSLGDLIRYAKDKDEDVRALRRRANGVYDCVSLDRSETDLQKLVKGPLIEREINWIGGTRDSILPASATSGCEFVSVALDQCCMISARDSFKDFEIDYGGVSAWTHVLRGEKVFYLVPHSAEMVDHYRLWMTDNRRTQLQQHLFENIERNSISRVRVQEGETIFIPSGCLYAVHTTKEAIALYTNFLSFFCVDRQLAVMELEIEVGTAEEKRYPDADKVIGYACAALGKRLNDSDQQPPRHLANAFKRLCNALKRLTEKEATRKKLPTCKFPTINSSATICDWAELLEDCTALLNRLEDKWGSDCFKSTPFTPLTTKRRTHFCRLAGLEPDGQPLGARAWSAEEEESDNAELVDPSYQQSTSRAHDNAAPAGAGGANNYQNSGQVSRTPTVSSPGLTVKRSDSVGESSGRASPAAGASSRAPEHLQPGGADNRFPSSTRPAGNNKRTERAARTYTTEGNAAAQSNGSPSAHHTSDGSHDDMHRNDTAHIVNDTHPPLLSNGGAYPLVEPASSTSRTLAPEPESSASVRLTLPEERPLLATGSSALPSTSTGAPPASVADSTAEESVTVSRHGDGRYVVTIRKRGHPTNPFIVGGFELVGQRSEALRLVLELGGGVTTNIAVDLQ